jgi:hypothetical protein
LSHFRPSAKEKKKRQSPQKPTEMDDSDSDDGHDGDEPVNKKEWVRKVSTHLNFLSGFNAFPGKRPGKLNPTIIFDAVQVFRMCSCIPAQGELPCAFHTRVRKK